MNHLYLQHHAVELDALPADAQRWRASLATGKALSLQLPAQVEVLQGATQVAQALGDPLDVYGDGQQWSFLRVDTQAQANRTHGVGENPLHIDYVQRSAPPALIILLGLRQDPHGGGQSIIAPFKPARAALSEAERQLLSQSHFKYWNDQGAQDVGEALERFAILDQPWTRFTAKMLPHLDGSATVLDERAVPQTAALLSALNHLHQSLIEHSIRLTLKPGQMLIFDQRYFAHGRGELGPGQASIPQEQRRLLGQCYLNP